VSHAVPAGLVQRQPLAISPALDTAARGIEIVQRVETPPAAAAEPPAAEAPQPNLDDLARQIYPLIKRMLAVERERRPVR
jgi:hypothetical protein